MRICSSFVSGSEILGVCRAALVPMVFDAHHHVVHEKLDSYEDPSIAEILRAARETWPVPEWQLVHISNGREFFNDRNHSDLITAMPSAYRSRRLMPRTAPSALSSTVFRATHEPWLYTTRTQTIKRQAEVCQSSVGTSCRLN